MPIRKGQAVRVVDDLVIEGRFRGATGVVTGLRPDGLVVVQFTGGVRAPFRAEQLLPI